MRRSGAPSRIGAGNALKGLQLSNFKRTYKLEIPKKGPNPANYQSSLPVQSHRIQAPFPCHAQKAQNLSPYALKPTKIGFEKSQPTTANTLKKKTDNNNNKDENENEDEDED